MPKTKILNFSHPLTPAQLEQISAAWGEPLSSEDVLNVKVQLDQAAPFEPQIEAILRDVVISDWNQTIINPPGHGHAAVVLHEQLKRKFGGDILWLRMKPVTTPAGMSFEYAEIMWL